MRRREILRAGLATAGGATLSGLLAGCDWPASRLPTGEAGGEPLWRRAARAGLLYGSVMNPRWLNDAAHAAAFARECALVVTPTKWTATERSLGQFTFAEPDKVAAFARDHRLLMRGHNLCWGDRQLAPVVLAQIERAPDVEQVLVNHVRAVVTHYAGRMHSWDVINEPLSKTAGNPLKTTNRVWYRRIGPQYLGVALRAARAADPKALLFVNDYGLEAGKAAETRYKREHALTVLSGLRSRGVPLDAFGTQAHVSADRFPAKFDPDGYRDFLAEIAKLGLKILVTELDVNDRLVTGDLRTRDAAVARVYRQLLDVALDEPAVIGVTTWGVSDTYSWLQKPSPFEGGNRGLRADGQPLRPLPLDDRLARKPAWDAVAHAFDTAPRRRLVSRIPVPRPMRS